MGEGDPLQCSKYRGLRVLEHGMELWEKILEGRLKEVVKISDNQFSFSAGKSTTEAIFILRHIQQKYSENKKISTTYLLTQRRLLAGCPAVQ